MSEALECARRAMGKCVPETPEWHQAAQCLRVLESMLQREAAALAARMAEEVAR